MFTINDCEFVFAYGSNLNVPDFMRWCASEDNELLRYESVAMLPDMRLCFNYYSNTRQGGVLNVMPALGSIVQGVLFKPNWEGWNALDRKEGAPYCYEKKLRQVILPDGFLVNAIVYEVVPVKREGFVEPNQNYLNVVREGLAHWQLSDEGLANAILDRATTAAIDFLFVYGTIMRGQSRAYVLDEHIISCCSFQTKGELFSTRYDFPAMRLLEDGDEKWVLGELVQLKDMAKLLPTLDKIEGFNGYSDSNSLYCRTLVAVDNTDSQHNLAWVYVMFDDRLFESWIESGSWREYMQDALN